MNINQPIFNVRRKRSPLIDLDPPKPLAVGEVCPHCGRVVQASVTLDPTLPEKPAVLADGHQVEPAVVSKPKKSRDDAAKN